MHDLATEIQKISPLDTTNQTLTRNNNLSDYEYTLEYFCQTNEYNKFVWSLDKGGSKKDEVRDSNSQSKLCINDLRASISALKEAKNPVATELRWLKSKLRTLSCEWLNCNMN